MKSYQDLTRRLRDFGCERLFIKRLSKNDNSKQQVYLGPDFDVLSSFPHTEIMQKQGTVRETGGLKSSKLD